MLETLTLAIWIVLTAAVTVGGFAFVKRFVRDRLRFVDAVRRPWVPLAAGAGAALLALPVVGILPILGIGTASLFGLGVGLGVSAGRRAFRRLPPA